MAALFVSVIHDLIIMTQCAPARVSCYLYVVVGLTHNLFSLSANTMMQSYFHNFQTWASEREKHEHYLHYFISIPSSEDTNRWRWHCWCSDAGVGTTVSTLLPKGTAPLCCPRSRVNNFNYTKEIFFLKLCTLKKLRTLYEKYFRFITPPRCYLSSNLCSWAAVSPILRH